MHLPYPKTPRLSKLTRSPKLLEWGPRHVVVEEKIDGANAAIHFKNGKLILQSRGHVLMGGDKEILFAHFVRWAYKRLPDLLNILGDQYIAYGEWCFAKNRIFYDSLPDYFIEFDIWDKQNNCFLSTPRRQALLRSGPLTSVAILHRGLFRNAPAFGSFIGPSRYKTSKWRSQYDELMKSDFSSHYHDSETDLSILMEGVYVKVEDQDKVIGRMKAPREEFEKIHTDDSKWLRRPLFPNLLSK